MPDLDFDIVVVGGGHAGAEAAWASARMGARTALVTLDKATIGQMSCNPAIGGIGKGQLVREIDALGGLMGLAADATGMQFRMLNRSKGPAVWGPRCQSDRHAYARFVQAALSALGNLVVIEGEVAGILTGGIGHSAFGSSGQTADKVQPVDRATRPCADLGTFAATPIGPVPLMPNAECSMPPRRDVIGISYRPAGTETTGRTIRCHAAIVTAGTFLRGLLHCGQRTWPGGRYDEPAAAQLSGSLEGLGIRLGRLKTGTCPRLAAESIDYSRCTPQDGDWPPAPFSFMTAALDVRQVRCHLTATNPRTHAIVRANLHRAPMHTGQITAGGPRYCPSLETKIARFADKDSHLVFLEPEGRDTNWVYPNGLSTSVPPDVQAALVHSIAGLERAEMLRLGYAIEYDFADPTQLSATLETKAVGGLFLAGQVNGTTGYEEAAAQGLLAGINAVARVRRQEPLVLRRDWAYIGVMIDDLVTKGVLEPYRMFTSRAENRLVLRADNADRRLTPLGRQVGLVDQPRWAAFSEKQAAGLAVQRLLDATRLDGQSLAEHLARPEVTVEDLLARLSAAASAGGAGLAAAVGELAQFWARRRPAVETVAIDCRYAGYVQRERAASARVAELENKPIPDGLDYWAVSHLRAEARERLGAIRPRSLGQALRVSGITPADIAVLMIHLTSRVKMDNM